MKKILTLFSVLLLSSLHSQTSNVSSNNNVVGLEHNTLFNATKRYTVSQSGPAMNLEKLFDGKFEADYSSGPVSNGSPKIVTIENLHGVHTQLGAWVGWSTRYYAAKRFKIEGYDTYNGAQWRTIADYSGTDYDSNLFITRIPIGGIYTKLKYTFYVADPIGLGISELFFLHPEATTPYEGLLNPIASYSATQGEWQKSEQNIYYDKGNVGIGGQSASDRLTVSGGHESTTMLLHANNGGSPHAYLSLWASEPGLTYHGTGIGNNVKNVNGQMFSQINTTLGGSYMRMLDNEINFNLVTEAGQKKQTVTFNNMGVQAQGNVQAENGTLRSIQSLDVGGSISLINPLKTGTLAKEWVIYNMSGVYGNSLQFWNYSADGAKATSRLKLSDEGDMALNGKLEAKEVKVTLTPTADFVFEEDYNLPKLEEVEKHIKEKKHLPEIASAKEMEKDGVNVGEFQIKLLQKIEELTLYSIEQNKKINLLIEENKEQAKKIKKIEEK